MKLKADGILARHKRLDCKSMKILADGILAGDRFHVARPAAQT
jgi:hypothetical protein